QRIAPLTALQPPGPAISAAFYQVYHSANKYVFCNTHRHQKNDIDDLLSRLLSNPTGRLFPNKDPATRLRSTLPYCGCLIYQPLIPSIHKYGPCHLKRKKAPFRYAPAIQSSTVLLPNERDNLLSSYPSFSCCNPTYIFKQFISFPWSRKGYIRHDFIHVFQRPEFTEGIRFQFGSICQYYCLFGNTDHLPGYHGFVKIIITQAIPERNPADGNKRLVHIEPVQYHFRHFS